MPAKMMSESPCPRMPYSEINSPNQMANMVPAVITSKVVSDDSHKSGVKPNGMIVCEAMELKILICPIADNIAIGTARRG